MPDSDLRRTTAEQLSVALAGRYIIEREIGAGGMATVFLARDVRHNRNVALKVLKPDLGAALGPERFLAEISVTANLQHPNLLPLFDSGEATVATGTGEHSSVLFYVMPYVQGETLRQRLERERQLPLDVSLRIATAIAGALNYAHRQGVIHRDLKPENILLHEDQPMVMDFGIALAVSNAGGERLTQMGLSLGTPQYMSPEQATGDRDLDARSDIYSLGAVTYEMLTGAPPHTGNTVQAVIAKVIMDRPMSVRATRELVPEHVDSAVTRALAKLPADRFETAGEFARALQSAYALAPFATHAPAPAIGGVALAPVGFRAALARPIVRRTVVGTSWIVLLGGAALAGALGALAWTRKPPTPFAKLPVVVPDSVQLGVRGRTIALSPDGERLAIAGTMRTGPSRLLTRPMAGVAFTALHGTEGGSSPAFSPDGQSLLFVVGGKLMKVSAEGGAALALADSTDGQHSWGGDAILFTRQGALWSVPSAGGSATLVAKPDNAQGERAYAWPDMLPGGTHALVTIIRRGASPDSNHLGVVSISDGVVKDLGVTGTGVRFAHPDHLVYATADRSLWAIPFSLRRHTVSGTKRLLAGDVHVDSTGAADVATSERGTMVLGLRAGAGSRGPNAHMSIAIVDRTGAIKSQSAQTGDFVAPRVSPDASRIALTVREPSNRFDVWYYELATGQLTPVTRNAMSHYAEWLDAKRLVFRVNVGGVGHYEVMPWDHSAEPKVFLNAVRAQIGSVFELSLGPPSGYMALIRNRRLSGSPLHQDIWIASMARPDDQREIVTTKASELSPRVSPNGKWLAYTSNESGTYQVYVQQLPGPGTRVPVSVEHGIEPAWSRDGKLLYYISGGLLLAAHIDESSGFRATRQDTLFSFADKGFIVRSPPSRGSSLRTYDVFPNGDIAVLARRNGTTEARAGIVALLNWKQLLTARERKEN